MLRIVYCAVMLTIITSGLAEADTFKCKRPDGTIIFTNDPSRMPDDCEIEKVVELPPIGIIPELQRQQAPVPSKGDADIPQAKTGVAKTLDDYKSEAVTLAGKFQSARRRFFQSSFAKDQFEARRELAEVRAQKNYLLSDMERSDMEISQKQEIEKILSSITE